MRQSLLTATFLAAASLAAAPLLADNHASEPDAPVSVSLTPDQLLAPYYAELRKKVAMPVAGPKPRAGACHHADPHCVWQLQPPIGAAAYVGADCLGQSAAVFDDR